MKTKFLFAACLISFCVSAQHLISFSETKDGTHYGFKDSLTGKIIIPAKFDTTDIFSEDLCAVELGGNWGYIDKSGKTIIEFKYEFASPFRDGLASVGLNGNNVVVNKKGKEFGGPDFGNDVRNSGEGFMRFYMENKYGLLDSTGKMILEPTYSGMSSFSDGLAVVDLGTLSGYINTKGKLVIPLKYSEAYPFEKGVATVMLDGAELKIDKTGKQVK